MLPVLCACFFHLLTAEAANMRMEVSEDADIRVATDATSLLQRQSSRTNTFASATRAVQQESLDISNRFAHAAKSSPAGGVTNQLFKSFEICGQCTNFLRFGESSDGGYLMCQDGLSKDKLTAAYSIGVEQHDKWSDDVVKHLSIPVNQFDCTVSSSPATCKGCKFYKKCLVAADGQHPVPGHENEGWSLSQALTETAHGDAPDGSLLMKMDIEGSEWPILASEPPAALKKFGQLILEFHWLEKEDKHPMYLQAMQHVLAAGFKVAHLHGNNYGSPSYKDGPMYTKGGLSIPCVLEVTFVHSGARPNGCATDQVYEAKDSPNAPGMAELPMAHFADA